MRAERRRKGFKLTGASVARFLLVAAGSLLLAWLVVRTLAVDALIRRNPIAAAAVAPDNPRVKIALAMLEFRLQGGRVSEASREGAFSALSRSPLAEDPFLLAGIDALAKGDTQKGEALLVETRRRDPRSRTARLILLDRYLRTNRTEQAGVEIAVLNRLVSRAAEVLVPELARMISDPKTGDALIGLLKKDKDMRDAVLARLAGGGADPDLILRVARSSGAGGRTGGPAPAWQPALLAKMVEKGDVRRAASLWRGFSGVSNADAAAAPYDGAFTGRPGPAPFNWQLLSSAAGVAERSGSRGLEVEYYGRERAALASQLLMLAPGRYRLSFRAEGDATGQGSRLAWIVSCNGQNGPQLLEAKLERIGSTPKIVRASFAVPAGCPAQWLRLTGIPDEFPTGQSATINDVRIGPEGQ